MRSLLPNKFSELLLIVVALAAAGWFFGEYSSQDPRSAVSVSMKEENIELKSAEILSELGYSLENYEQRVVFRSNDELLDSLQHRMGRKKARDLLTNNPQPDIKPYFWYVVFEPTSEIVAGEAEADQDGSPFSDEENWLIVKLDEEGQFIDFENSYGTLPEQIVNRQALTSVFRPGQDTAQSEVFTSEADSLLNRMLYFDLEQSFDEEPSRLAEIEIQERFREGRPYRYSARDAESMARYYLEGTGWASVDFEVDTVTVERVRSINSANVTFINADTDPHQQQLSVDVQITPTGSLLSISHEYNNQNGSDDSFPLWPLIRLAFSFFIGLAGVIAFFFRMRSRAIDTQSALVTAVVAGLAIPMIILLNQLGNVNFSSLYGDRAEQILLMIQMGGAGALTSVGFFVLFALGDSLTRQYWPEKLYAYDYLRQGMFFNKPLGVTGLRAVALSFVLAGVWMCILYIFPTLYLDIEYIFLNEKVAWAPLYLLVDSLWITLLVVLATFLAIGGQVYAWSKNKVAVSFATIVTSGIFVPLLVSAGPPFQQFLAGCLIGAALTAIYLKWDFLTLFGSLFLFLLLLGSAPGWMVPASPDALVFGLYIIVVIFLGGVGLLARYKGKEERALPKYIPEYVEELAQEERIKQELEIARGVQQSFLPSEMPKLEGLDIASICKPAHETGGDYYDVIKLSDKKIAVTIGDVSGKGVPAAFYMTFMKGIIHSLCRETESPADLLIKANRLFVENAKKGTFVSLVYGIINLDNRTFTFARAGHNPIIKINNRTGEVDELKPTGLGLGLADTEEFEKNIKEIELPFTENDTLVLYTDGIVEAQNNIRDFYTTEKLRRSLMWHLKQSSEKILRYSMDEVTSFIGTARQHDDMTMMVIRLNSTKKE